MHDLADEAFDALRERIQQEVGWDALASLENAFVPITTVLDPGFGQPIWARGTPRLAAGETGLRTLHHFVELSAPFGTHIDLSDGVGQVRLDR